MELIQNNPARVALILLVFHIIFHLILDLGFKIQSTKRRNEIIIKFDALAFFIILIIYVAMGGK